MTRGTLPTADLYRRHLERQILPYWLENGIDRELGGFYTCFDNRGKHLVSTDKYTWSQGRFIWLLAKASELAEKNAITADAKELLRYASAGAQFVIDHAVLPDLSCRYVVARDGGPVDGSGEAGSGSSLYADSFVVLGLSELARVTGSDSLLEHARRIYAATDERIRSGIVRTEPYPIPPGFSAYGVAMIMLSTATALHDAACALGRDDGAQSGTRDAVAAWLDTMTSHYVVGQDVEELTSGDGRQQDTLLGRHRTPGHAVEGMAFAVQAAIRLGTAGMPARASGVVARAMDVGWDEEYGGLYRYVDKEGRAPSGRLVGGRLESLIRETWDTKLWWPQVEALYATRLCYELTGSQEMARWTQRVHDYTFSVFPARADEGLEWIQIRDRQNRPLDKVVALPVKDPFHITRSLLLLVELLTGPNTVNPEGSSALQ
ncbi:MAG: AGE family epimerase/isomerase [Acidimicrobiales bacterium]